MKCFLRHVRFSWFVLGVYFFGLLGATLHHHAEDSSERFAPGAVCQLQEGASKASCHEDSDSCAICTALHQAKAQPPILSLTVAVLPAGDVTTRFLEPSISSAPLVKQARGPPVSSEISGL